MGATADARRAVIAMCCAVARADGEVSPQELEKLFEILSRLGDGVVSYAELQSWLDAGPPPMTAQLSEEELRASIRHGLSVAHADGAIDDDEVAVIRRYAGRHLQGPGSA